ncbi:hypothetical protein GGR58DRAFT_507894 [Xylaria digitata]|nr:hypothetical protein GGR58DRAFT_507894 [Xylaria digitata]
MSYLWGRIIIWKGIIGLRTMIGYHHLSQEDNRIVDAMKSTQFRPLRQQLYQDQYHWFKNDDIPNDPGSFFNVVIKLETLRQYGVEQSNGTAVVWLCNRVNELTPFSQRGSNLFQKAFSLRRRLTKRSLPSPLLFWGTDLLNNATQYSFPSLDEFHEIDNGGGYHL